MSTRGQVLAKSLHTITVLQNLAVYLIDQSGGNMRTDHAIGKALDILQLRDKPDVYELAKTAQLKLTAERKKDKQ